MREFADDELTQSGCPIARSLIVFDSLSLSLFSFFLFLFVSFRAKGGDVFMHLLER